MSGLRTAWPAAEEAPPVREFLAHAWLRRRHGLGAIAAIFLPMLLLSALLPAQFRSTATLAVLPAPEFTVRPDAGSKDQNNSALALDQIMKSESEILGSDALHAAVLTQLGVAALYPDLAEPARPGWVMQALAWLLRPWLGRAPADADVARVRALQRFGDHLTIRATKDANVIDLAFDHRDAATAAHALDALLATYARRRTRLYDDPQLNVVRDETAAAARAAAAASDNLAAFKARHAISNYDEQRDLLLKRLSDARQAMTDAAATTAEQEARGTALAAAIRATPTAVNLYHEHDSDARLQTIDDGLVELRGRLAAARVHYRETSRMVSDLRHQLAAREAERAQLAADPSPSVQRTGPSPARDQLELDHARAVAERVAALRRWQSLRDNVAALVAEAASLEAYERTLDSLQRQKDMSDETLRTATRVLAERRLTEAEDSLRLANVRVIQPAQVPSRPTPLKLLLLLGGAIGGALAGGLAVLWGFVARPSFLTAEGLAAATGLPVLGVFPAVPVEA